MFKIGDREIRFRVWDKNEKFMEELAYPWMMIGDEVVNAATGEKWRDIELMQFTGSYDKNKREIYEGDIVKWKVQLGDDKSIIRNDEIFGLVEWSNDNCRFFLHQLTEGKWASKFDDILPAYTSGQDFVEHEYDTEFYSYDGQEFDWKDLEVVGNKYQNPEYFINRLSFS